MGKGEKNGHPGEDGMPITKKNITSVPVFMGKVNRK
jgi:hypothetical protein